MKTFRLLFLTLVLFCSSFKICPAQAGEWTWMKGDSTVNSTGSFGVQGIPSPTNEPYARYACGYWTDTAGNFWIYSGANGRLASSDLWEFDPNTLMWTWMNGDSIPYSGEITSGKGVYNSQNSPGTLGYGMFTWVTPDNHLWLFGGLVSPPNQHVNSDLWQYDPSINQWAWMGAFDPVNYGIKGTGNSSTKPAGRQEGNCAWTDSSGNLWLFGGEDNNEYSYNDVWEYNVTSAIWTWMSGSSNRDDSGSYGTIGQPSVNNYPAARSTNLFWKDDEGNFWLAGGTQSTHDYMYQDVWKFNPQTLQWTWIKGIPAGDTSSKSGNYCITDTLNKAGPRYENRSVWKICDDLIIAYGGFTDWGNVFVAEPNDLSAYKSSQNEWLKINSWPAAGSYGIMGIATSTNNPPSRFGPVGFKDKDNNLWTFGGQNHSGTYFNDLWKYTLDTNCVGSLICSSSCNLTPPVITASDTVFCFEDSAQLCALTGFSTYQWNSGVTGTGNCIYAKQPGGYFVIVTDNNGCSATSNQINIAVLPVPLDSISSNKTIICAGDSAEICAQASFFTYQWNVGGTGSCTEAKQDGNYYVTITDANGCTAESNQISVSVYPLSSVSIVVQGDTLSSYGAISYQWYLNNDPINNATGPVYVAKETGSYSLDIIDTNGCTAISSPVEVTITGINNLEEVPVSIYPNPTVSSWQLAVGTELIGSKLEVYDDEGSLVFHSEISNQKSEIAAGELPAGIYYLRISSANVSIVEKLVKL